MLTLHTIRHSGKAIEYRHQSLLALTTVTWTEEGGTRGEKKAGKIHFISFYLLHPEEKKTHTGRAEGKVRVKIPLQFRAKTSGFFF